MIEPKTIRIKGDGIGIQAAEWSGDGATVLCVHGLTANCRSFDEPAKGISPPHRVLAVDLRGRGLSDKPDHGYSIEHHVRDLAAAAADLGLEDHFVMGHSLGAYIGLAYTAAHPERVRGLVLMDGGADLSPAQWLKVSAGIKPSIDRLGMVFPSFEDYLAQVKLAPFLHPWNETLENYFRYESEAAPGGGVRSRIDPRHIDEERGNLIALRPTDYYPRISCPVLILRAAEPIITGDDFVLPEEVLPAFLASLPQAKLVNMEGMNHYSLVLQPCPARDEALREFLLSAR
jgi:pimeloyl-ACP methyl ester carboxylesterase